MNKTTYYITMVVLFLGIIGALYFSNLGLWYKSLMSIIGIGLLVWTYLRFNKKEKQK